MSSRSVVYLCGVKSRRNRKNKQTKKLLRKTLFQPRARKPFKKNPNTPVMSEDELMTKDDKSQKEASHHEGDAADAGNRRVSAPKWRYETL